MIRRGVVAAAVVLTVAAALTGCGQVDNEPAPRGKWLCMVVTETPAGSAAWYVNPPCVGEQVPTWVPEVNSDDTKRGA